MTGFEPAALWSQTRCATKLRYIPTYVLCRFALAKRLVYNSKDIWFCKPRLQSIMFVFCSFYFCILIFAFIFYFIHIFYKIINNIENKHQSAVTSKSVSCIYNFRKTRTAYSDRNYSHKEYNNILPYFSACYVKYVKSV